MYSVLVCCYLCWWRRWLLGRWVNRGCWNWLVGVLGWVLWCCVMLLLVVFCRVWVVGVGVVCMGIVGLLIWCVG